MEDKILSSTDKTRKNRKPISYMLAIFMLFSFLRFDVKAATQILIFKDIPVYSNASDALNRVNSVGTYTAGTYYVYKTYNNMLNISKSESAPGAWINPADNINTNITQPTVDPALLTMNGWIENATVTPGPYKTGQVITVTATALGDAYKVNEYMLYINGAAYGTWSSSSVLTYQLTTAGTNTIQIRSKNKYKSTVEDSRTFTINVSSSSTDVVYPKAYIDTATISPGPYFTGGKITVTATPYGMASTVNEYALFLNGTRVTNYSSNPQITYNLPSGNSFVVMIVSRNKITQGPIEDSRSFSITANQTVYPKAWINTASISPGPYTTGSLITVTATPYAGSESINEYALYLNGVQVTQYSQNPSISYILPSGNSFVVMIVSRNRITKGPIEDSRSFSIIANQAVYPKAWIDTATITPGPYGVGKSITVTATANAGAESINEYALYVNGTQVSQYSVNPSFSYTLPSGGNFAIMIVSRNKITKGAIEDSRTFNIVASGYPKAWIDTATITPGPYKEGSIVNVNVTPYKDAGTVNEYALFINGVLTVPYSTSTSLSAPLPYGTTVSVMVASRNRFTKSAIEDSRTFTLSSTNVNTLVLDSPYFTVASKSTTGILGTSQNYVIYPKAGYTNLEYSVTNTQSPSKTENLFSTFKGFTLKHTTNADRLVYVRGRIAGTNDIVASASFKVPVFYNSMSLSQAGLKVYSGIESASLVTTNPTAGQNIEVRVKSFNDIHGKFFVSDITNKESPVTSYADIQRKETDGSYIIHISSAKSGSRIFRISGNAANDPNIVEESKTITVNLAAPPAATAAVIDSLKVPSALYFENTLPDIEMEAMSSSAYTEYKTEIIYAGKTFLVQDYGRSGKTIIDDYQKFITPIITDKATVAMQIKVTPRNKISQTTGSPVFANVTAYNNPLSVNSAFGSITSASLSTSNVRVNIPFKIIKTLNDDGNYSTKYNAKYKVFDITSGTDIPMTYNLDLSDSSNPENLIFKTTGNKKLRLVTYYNKVDANGNYSEVRIQSKDISLTVNP